MGPQAAEDEAFLRSVPSGVIEEFRDQLYNTSYIHNNPQKFLNTAWIDVDELRRYLA
ncbi:hypothetical protein H0H92_012705 [Tricholoma furcatifolium]|nr:hypothetical protein H0H92_003046 [Tricholoma furcatifolium]KAG6804849.1 hypothetical protein H0H92_002016 [Tricholoma furcatifolium]KAG6806101.1 hypothetical protein H0H92_012705 [Tricholoma furcatifolium]